MFEFHPYYTNDGSVGLYNNEYDDIYHSADGALTEAYEKFIYPIDFSNLLKKEKICVLDICYGIGYNSKSFLNFILENFISPYGYESIYSDNNLLKEKYNDMIYTNKIFSKIFITALDIDENLFFLSPFIKTGVKKIKNKNIDFEYSKIDKYLKNNNAKHKIKINNLINFLILDKLVGFMPNFTGNSTLLEIISDSKYKSFLDPNFKGIYQILSNKPYTFNIKPLNWLNLHNIYYQYLSKHYKNGIKRLHLDDINFNPRIGDARVLVKNDSNVYDLIFLDAFTPSKCPCLWSFEFFKELFRLLDEEGILLTYSMSAPVRNAMIKSGFYIGNIYNERLKKYTGTIAAKKNSKIKHPLSKFDLGLLETKSGIVYHDKNLMSQNEAIIEARNNEVRNSNLLSGSQYKKSKIL